ncbi:MAG: SLC5/6 family protein [Dehalococcoidia bacterium]
MATREAVRGVFAPSRPSELTVERPLRMRDQALLWGALSMSLLVFVPAAYLVPALSLRDAIAIAIGGSFAGAALLAAVAAAAAARRRNTVGLLSSALGVPAGTLVAALLVVRHLVWAVFTLAFAANVAAHVPGLAGPRAVWAIALGAVALALALLPPRTFVQRWIGWFAFWVGLLLIVLVTLTGIATYGIPMLHDADGLGGWPTRAQGFDLIAAMPLLWLPVVADYAYDTPSARDAGVGVFAGAGVMTAWYAVVGELWVSTVNARDVAGFMSALPIGAGGLLVVVALQSNAVAANVYAASQAAGRFGYRWFRPALVCTGVIAGVIVAATDALGVEDLALLLAAVLVPLFAVALVRALMATAPTSAAWVAWAAGILAYGWIDPGGVTAWRVVMRFIFSTVLHAPFPLGGELTPIPATVVSAVVAAGLYAVLAAPAAVRRRG